ncbi:dipeptide epimerase [Xanthocytophaga agilis]|uniref:Dipeptide epimerase n=1 Tax=Xanthocytophaga agilis TaxID=3048010 RepID=A0AAE3R6M4_9BACT|nr:dipeptide epimerase [Xanthocytophaga agilis]MDJ1504185.1 dipeptide epimerase [Xanthocytophaga agilis]
MKIKHIYVSRPNLELIRPYTIAYKTVSSVENCIVEIVTENELYGLGAANPSPYVVGESLDDMWKAVQSPQLDWLLGRDIRHIGTLCREVQEWYPKSPGVRIALETALLDVFTKYLGVPLTSFLGQKITSLPTSITIGIKDVEATLVEAEEYVGRGFRVLKVKLGKSLDEDIERIVKLREVYGNDIVIRIDANQGYTVQDLSRFYQQIGTLNIELVEQPLPAYQILEMKNLPEEQKLLIAADESLVTPQDAFRLAESPAACGIFNIKLMKCGGITQAMEIAQIARKANIDLMWGCNDESIISIVAALHTALACPNTKYLDLDGSLDLAKDVVSGGFILKDGILSVNGEPGLGVKKI